MRGIERERERDRMCLCERYKERLAVRVHERQMNENEGVCV